jgi:hypothetical protein
MHPSFPFVGVILIIFVAVTIYSMGKSAAWKEYMEAPEGVIVAKDGFVCMEEETLLELLQDLGVDPHLARACNHAIDHLYWVRVPLSHQWDLPREEIAQRVENLIVLKKCYDKSTRSEELVVPL